MENKQSDVADDVFSPGLPAIDWFLAMTDEESIRAYNNLHGGFLTAPHGELYKGNKIFMKEMMDGSACLSIQEKDAKISLNADEIEMIHDVLMEGWSIE